MVASSFTCSICGLPHQKSPAPHKACNKVNVVREVIITATTEGTQRRIVNLARPEYFIISIDVAPVLRNNLSDDEYARLTRKLLLVQDSAQRLCAAMVKGTLKYDRDDLSLQEWYNHLREEAVDQVNYLSLMEESVEKASANNS